MANPSLQMHSVAFSRVRRGHSLLPWTLIISTWHILLNYVSPCQLPPLFCDLLTDYVSLIFQCLAPSSNRRTCKWLTNEHRTTCKNEQANKKTPILYSRDTKGLFSVTWILLNSLTSPCYFFLSISLMRLSSQLRLVSIPEKVQIQNPGRHHSICIQQKGKCTWT